MSAFDSLGPMANASMLGVFGIAVLYEQPPAEAFSVTAILSVPGRDEDMDPAYRRLWVRLSDFAQGPAAGDLVTISEVAYIVTGRPRPDGEGGTTLTLNQTQRAIND